MSYTGLRPKFNTTKYNPRSSDPTNPTEGEVQYADGTARTEGLWVYKNGSWTQVGSGAGGAGGINYIDNFGAENDTVGWSVYADAAASRPVDGTGGSPNVTFTRSITSPLRGDASFIFTKDAVNRQGQGTSYDFTIAASDKAKVLQISFDYLVDSGTFVAGTNTTDSDVIVYIYDITNAVLIEPSSIKLLSNHTSISDTFNATFQTSSNSTSYRLILHVASTSASAYSLKIDDISVSPSTYVYGTPITDWQFLYQNTSTGSSWTANTNNSAKWRRVGDCAEMEFLAALVGAPTATQLSFTWPTSVGSLDTTKIMAGSSARVGNAFVIDNGVNLYEGSALILSPGSANPLIYPYWDSGGSLSGITSTSPITFGNADSVKMTISVPIVGFSSSVQMSDQTDTRVANFTARKTASQATTADVTKVTFPSNILDTHGAWNGTDTYTVPVSGDYKVSGAIRANANTSMYIWVNGSRNKILNRINATEGIPGSVLIKNLKVGDTIDIRTSDSVTVSGSAGNEVEFLCIARESGPSAIAASETINAKYTNNAGTSITNTAATVTYATKHFDTHGAYSGGVFTAPTSGKYLFSVGMVTQSVSWSTNQAIEIHHKVNAAASVIFGQIFIQNAHTGPVAAYGTTELNLVAGDTVAIQLRSSVAVSLATTTDNNFLVITKVGN